MNFEPFVIWSSSTGLLLVWQFTFLNCKKIVNGINILYINMDSEGNIFINVFHVYKLFRPPETSELTTRVPYMVPHVKSPYDTVCVFLPCLLACLVGFSKSERFNNLLFVNRGKVLTRVNFTRVIVINLK